MKPAIAAVASLFVTLWPSIVPLKSTTLGGRNLAEAQGRKASSKREPTLIFRSIEPEVRRQSLVPLRLPSFLPYLDAKNPIYASLRSVDPSGYDIVLGYGTDCKGAPTCLYAELRGSSTPIKEETTEVRVPVVLSGGTKGYFIDFTCGANCSESFVGWSEGGFYYSVGMKAQKEETLIKIANSAIEYGSGKSR